MILNADNNLLLCKVFPTSLQGPALAWFHKLPRNSINSFNASWAAFISQYLCSVRQKRNINSLQAISSRNWNLFETFKRRFEQAIQQVEFYSMDAILQNFRRSFGSSTPFFQSLYLDPPKTMEELYSWADKYLMLEDNVYTATQTVMITSQSIEGHKAE